MGVPKQSFGTREFLKSPSLFQRCFSAGIGRDPPKGIPMGRVGQNRWNLNKATRNPPHHTLFFKKIFEINSKFKIILAETARLPPFKHESK
jgi:hypothetical protein